MRSDPPDAEITLDSKTVRNRSWLLQSGTLIKNLLPGRHELTVSKSGYRDWKKYVTVAPSLVNEIDSIVLVKDGPPTKLTETLEDAWLTNNGTVVKNSGILFFLGQPLQGHDFISIDSDHKFLLSATTTPKTKQRSLLLINNDTKKILELDALLKSLRERNLREKGAFVISRAEFHPDISGGIFIGGNGGLYAINSETEDIQKIASSTVKITGLASSSVSYAATNFMKPFSEAMYFETMGGRIARYEYQTGITRLIPTTTVNMIYDLIPFTFTGRNALAVLEKNGSLRVIVEETGAEEILATDAVAFSMAPDTEKIAFSDSDGKISVKYLDEKKQNKNTGFYPDLEGVVVMLVWYRDSAHLLAHYDSGKLYFIETDGISPINAYLIGESVKKFRYDSAKNTVQFFGSEALFEFNFEN